MENKFIVWKEEYAVGSGELDGHHRRLIEIVNGLYEVASAGASDEQINEAVRELDAYGRIHFQAEEETLSKVNYPRLDDQRRAHEAYVRKLDELRRSFFIPKSGLSQEIFQFLKEWWLNHILKMDKEYAPHLRQRQS